MRKFVKQHYDLTYSKETPQALGISVKGFPRDRFEALIYLSSRFCGNRILEIGCGNGKVLYNLRDKFRQLYGIEASSVRAETAKKTLSGINAKIIVADIEEDLEFEEGFFDLVIWSDVIEHIVDLWRAMDNIKRITANGGILITTTPNVAKIKGRFRLLLGKFPSTSGKNEGFEIREHEMFDGGHLHYFTFSMLKNLYLKYGFEPKKMIGFGRFGAIHNIYPSLLSPSIGIIGQKVK